MLNILKANLFLFDGDAAGTAAESTEEAGTPKGEPNIPWDMLKNKPDGIDGAKGSGEKTAQQDSKADISVQKSWEEAKKLYKSDYQRDVDSAVKRRLKTADTEISGLKKTNAQMKEFIDFVANKYPGVDKSDMAAMLEAVKNDDSYLRQKAIDNGTTVEQELDTYDKDRELAEARRRLADVEAERAKRATFAELQRQSNALRETYPDFDLGKALDNDEFVAMLKFTKSSEGVENVQKAYEVAFADVLREQAIRQTVDKTKAAVSHNRKAKQFMPSPPGSVGKNKASNNVGVLETMSATELANRRLQGEDISRYFK